MVVVATGELFFDSGFNLSAPAPVNLVAAFELRGGSGEVRCVAFFCSETNILPLFLPHAALKCFEAVI